MIANTFDIAIPGWSHTGPTTNSDVSESERQQTSLSPSNTAPSTSSTSPDEEEMIELELSPGSSENADEDPLRGILLEMGLDLSNIVQDQDDLAEYQVVEQGLERVMPSSTTILCPNYGMRYVLTSRLRSSCVTHLLQLVIKDGLKSLQVPFLHLF